MTDTFSEREKRIERMENRLNALKSQQKTQARSRDTKRLVLMGRMLEQYLKFGKVNQADFRRDMDGFLTRDYEREIFDLPPVNATKSPAKKSPASRASKGNPVVPSPPTPAPSSIPRGRTLPEHGVSEAEFLT